MKRPDCDCDIIPLPWAIVGFLLVASGLIWAAR
jgi:hypothetical protein